MTPESQRIGWRHFLCLECDHRWKWPCRDCFSLSSECCPKCFELCVPCYGEPDPTIPHDRMGNLTVPYNWAGPDERPSHREVL